MRLRCARLGPGERADYLNEAIRAAAEFQALCVAENVIVFSRAGS